MTQANQPNDPNPPTLDIDKQLLLETGIAFTKKEADQIRRRAAAFIANQSPVSDLAGDESSPTPPVPPTIPNNSFHSAPTPPAPALSPPPAQTMAQKRRKQANNVDSKLPTAPTPTNLRHIPPKEYAQQVDKILEEHTQTIIAQREAEGNTHVKYAFPVPQSLTPDRFGRMLSAIEQGMSRKGAAAMVGIHQSTWNKWQSLAQQGEPPYEALFGLIAFAESRIELYMLSSWVRAAETDWKAAQSYLERRFPQEWGSRPQITLSLPQLDALSDDQLEEIKGDVIELDAETGNYKSTFSYQSATNPPTTTPTTDQADAPITDIDIDTSTLDLGPAFTNDDMEEPAPTSIAPPAWPSDNDNE